MYAAQGFFSAAQGKRNFVQKEGRYTVPVLMNHSCFSSYLLTSLVFNESFKILV